MNFANDDELEKAIMNAGQGKGMDVDDELDALEAEVFGASKGKKSKEDLDLEALEKEDYKPKRKTSDDELAALENEKDYDDELAALEKEGLDDLDEEEEIKTKPKQQKKTEAKTKPQPQPQPKPQPQKQVPAKPKPQPSKQVPAKPIPQPQIIKQEAEKPKQKGGVDLYPEKTEKKYHDVEKMTSLGVLEKEDQICDMIIDYKKKREADYDTWEDKKESIKMKKDIIYSYINDEIWDFEMYKKKIKEQYQWESKLLLFVEKDPSLNEEQKNILKQRVNERKQIIEKELTTNIEEQQQEAEKEEKEKSKKEEGKISKNPTSTSTSSSTSGNKAVDYYPEKVENKYHSVAKMDSLGVLEKELQICDIIIAYKKKKGEDYDTWELKKDSIETKKQVITSNIESGGMDFEMYKKKIQVEYQWEAKLLVFVEKDTTLKEEQKKILIQRVNNRKKIIEEELTKDPNAEAQGQEKEEQKPKEVPKKEELITKKSLNPMFSVPKEKEADEIKRLTQVVTDRLNEYRSAIDYFQKNEFSEQQTNAIRSAKQIAIELKKIQEGKWKEVNEFKLPDPIIPEYIYGYSKEERQKKFAAIIKDYKNQKETVSKDLNARIEALKKLTKAQFKKVEAAAKRDLEALKTKRDKLQKIINLLFEKFQDKWVPAPLYMETEEEKTIEKINSDIPENFVRLIFGKTTYKKNDRLYLIVTLQEKNLSKTFDQKGAGDWSQQFDWKFEKNDFKSFFKMKIHVDIYEKKTILKDRFRGNFDIEPRGLRDHIEYTYNIKLNLEDTKDAHTVEVTFKVRTPCKDPEYTSVTKSFFQVKKIYPAFNIRGGNNNESAITLDVPTKTISSDDLKVSSGNKPSAKTPSQAQKVPKSKAQQVNANPKQGGGGAKKGGAPKEIIDKSEFKEEELKDPDCIDCLNTLQVLEFKYNKYEEIRNKIDGRTPRELMQKIVKIKCKLQNLQDALGDEIGPQDYLLLLRTTFNHDKKLADYFNQQKDTEKSKLVSERLPLLIKETEELMKQMPK